jgi:hypothetical protein
METKPGIQTTEFWAMVVTVVLPWLATIADNTDVVSIVPEKYRWVLPVIASFATALSAGLYAVGRGKAKQGIPYQP